MSRDDWKNYLPWAGLCLFFMLAMFGDKGLLRLWQIEQESVKLGEELQDAQDDTILLEREVRALRNDPAHIEKVVREELQLVRENEILYRFED